MFRDDKSETTGLSRHMLHSPSTAAKFYDKSIRTDQAAREGNIISKVLNRRRLTASELEPPNPSEFILRPANNTLSNIVKTLH